MKGISKAAVAVLSGHLKGGSRSSFPAIFSAISTYCKACFFCGTSRHSLIFLDSKLLLGLAQVDLRIVGLPYLRRGYPLSERKIERKINIDSEQFLSSEVLFTYSIGADAEFACEKF